MDKFLERHKLLKLTQDERDNPNTCVTRDRASNPKTNQAESPSPDGITAELHQTFKKEIITNFFYKLIKKIRRGGEETLPNSFYKVNITMILKVDKRHHKKRILI